MVFNKLLIGTCWEHAPPIAQPQRASYPHSSLKKVDPIVVLGYFHVTLHEVSIEPHVPNKNSKMEVLPAELHPHVDAIDIEEGFFSSFP